MEIREVYVRHRDDEIDYSDIPEITDFSKGWRDPARAERMKNGYIMIEEHEDYNLVIEITKRRVPKNQCLLTL
ncbi:MAG: hypothetical protein FWB74_00780 [Defluviitaleaceae bacterium]|nr:hypothetical protein [Defluviitaleaceae bacterium]